MAGSGSLARFGARLVCCRCLRRCGTCQHLFLPEANHEQACLATHPWWLGGGHAPGAAAGEMVGGAARVGVGEEEEAAAAAVAQQARAQYAELPAGAVAQLEPFPHFEVAEALRRGEGGGVVFFLLVQARPHSTHLAAHT